jgi:magnesium/cobalt transport protein CorA
LATAPALREIKVPEGLVLRGVSFNPKTHETHRFGQDDLDRELRDPDVFSWIDLQAPDISVLNDVLHRWDIDLVLTSHFDAPEILPRIVERPDCLAFYLYEVEDPERHLDTAHGLVELEAKRLILVLGTDYVITFHRRPLAAVDDVRGSCEAAFRLAGRTPGFIAFLFLQRCLYDYAHLNLANDNALDLIEHCVMKGDQRAEADIATAGSNILTLKKLVASLHIVLMLLATKRSPFVSAEARTFYQEMLQNALAVRAAVDSSRDMLDGILQSIQTAAANRTSEIARVLTVMSGILMPMALVTGLYGMNFENMPELHWRYGYFGVLGVLAAMGAALYVLFHRLGWVGTGRSLR